MVSDFSWSSTLLDRTSTRGSTSGRYKPIVSIKMNLYNISRTLALMVSASSTRVIRVKNIQGDYVKVPVARAATHALVRPPFILSAPIEKRVWSQKEIEEFYQLNPAF